MNVRQILCRVAGLALALACVGAVPAGAFEAHSFLEPSFGSFSEQGSMAVDQTNGNVLVAEEVPSGTVQVFGREGGGPAAGVQSSFNGAANPAGSFFYTSGFAVNGSSRVAILDLSAKVYEYGLGSSGEYEYLCEIAYYGPTERCLPEGGEASEGTVPNSRFSQGDAYDADGNLYVIGSVFEGHEQPVIFEFNPASEGVRVLELPAAFAPVGIAVAGDGTIYERAYNNASQQPAVLAFKRSSLAGPLEGELVIPGTEGASGIAVDRADGQLFVDLGSYAEALNGSDEVVSRFGRGVITQGTAIAVDEASGEVYVFNRVAHAIDRFAAGVPAFLPSVDSPPPTVTALTRTSAELSGTVNTGDATTTYQLQYVAGGEYQAGASDPYAGGGSTTPVKLIAGASGESVGPLALSGLSAGTTYHYRFVATNELGTTDGPDHTFTTLPATPPAVSTGGALEVTQTGVVLTGSVGTEELQSSYEFEVGTDTGYGGAKLFGNAGASGTEAVSASLQYLIPGTTYHYRLVATNEDGTTDGQDMTFTTAGVSAPISQPATAALISSPVVAFPSVAGAITKPQAKKKSKAKSKAKRKSEPRAKRHGKAKSKPKKEKRGARRS
jgi:hypothetical protein